jgi:hypothetical protein
MRFLLERISKEAFFCSVYDRMRKNIAEHARNYRDRFDPVEHNAPAAACR